MSRFTYHFQVPVATLLDQVRRLAATYQGNFQGDERSGRFSLSLFLGSIAGDYTIDGEELRLVITQKPRFLSGAAIDAAIRKYLPVLS